MTRVEIVEDIQWIRLLGFGGFCLKTMGGRFAGFGPQNPRQDLGTECVITRELASRRSVFVRCKELNLDYFAHVLKWFKKNI